MTDSHFPMQCYALVDFKSLSSAARVPVRLMCILVRAGGEVIFGGLSRSFAHGTHSFFVRKQPIPVYTVLLYSLVCAADSNKMNRLSNLR